MAPPTNFKISEKTFKHPRLAAFAKRFGEDHINLACHAAFPLALTSELLYCLRENFQSDVPWIAVADILLYLCDPVGYQLYELPGEVRNELLVYLIERFGQTRLCKSDYNLSDFMLAYIRQQLKTNKYADQDLGAAPYWTALAYISPEQAVHDIAEALKKVLERDNPTDWVRLTSLLESYADIDPLIQSGFQPLLMLARGWDAKARGQEETAVAEFNQLGQPGEQIEIGGVKFEIPPIDEPPEIDQLEFRKNSKNYWLFQGNPKSYRMLDAIRDLERIFWPINRYKKDIAVEDGVLIWLSGKESGIYAFGEVIEPLKKLDELPEIDYWIDTSLLDSKRNQDHVRIRLTTKLLQDPLLRKELKEDPILRDLSIIKIKHGSVFKVTLEQWKRVNELAGLSTEVPVTDNLFEFEVATVNSGGKIIKGETKQAKYFRENLSGDITLDMVLIPGGSFMMGSPEDELKRSDSESPQHLVNINQFCMGKYPVTQEQWRAVAALPQVHKQLDADPSNFKGEQRPVEQVSWYDAVEFCDRLSSHTKRQYRLPSEAEWEYACRAETTSPFHFGETITSELANYDARKVYGRGVEGTYRRETTPVGSFNAANTFGLYDMHGNVWEWCLDNWHDNYERAPSDGSPWSDNNNLSPKQKDAVLRGGSWSNKPDYCRSASRDFKLNRDSLNYYFGFRVVCGAGRII